MSRRLTWLLASALGCATPPRPSEPKPAIDVDPVKVPDPPTEVSATPPEDYPLDEPRAPMRRACKVTSQGKCPYQAPSNPEKYAWDESDRAQLRALEHHLSSEDDPERVRDLRYMRFVLLVKHRELGHELDDLEAFVEEHDGHPISVWAATLLFDELSLRAFEVEEPSVDDLDTLLRWIERIETMKLSASESADDLRHSMPILRAATLWLLALDARDRGRFGECADRFLEISKQYEDHDRASELLVRAADCLESQGRIDESKEVRKRMLKRFPNSEYADEQRRKLAP